MGKSLFEKRKGLGGKRKVSRSLFYDRKDLLDFSPLDRVTV